MRGQPAALVRYEGAASVRWQRAPRQWLDVTAAEPLTAEDALAVARSLKQAPLRQPAEFDVTVAPDGFVLAEHHQGGVTLGPPDGVPNPQDDPRAIVVVVRQASSGTDGHGQPVRVGERSGWLDQRNGRYDLVLRLDDITRLQITTPASGQWNREELARFAAGVSYTEPRPDKRGDLTRARCEETVLAQTRRY